MSWPIPTLLENQYAVYGSSRHFFSIMAIIQAFGFFCGHGSGNFISRRLGARDYRSAERMAATGFFCAFFIGCLIALIGLLFLGPICLALGSTPTILPYAKTYLGIILLGAPFMASSLVLNNQMRFREMPYTP